MLKSAESIYLHIEAMNRNHNYVLNLVIAFTVLSSLIGCGETVKETTVDENLTLAKDYFYSGQEGTRYIYRSVLTQHFSPSNKSMTTIDTITLTIGKIDTLPNDRYVVREVSYTSPNMDYPLEGGYAFENNDWYQWVYISTDSRNVKNYELQNPIKVGATFVNSNHPALVKMTNTIVSTDTMQVVSAGRFSCLAVRSSNNSNFPDGTIISTSGTKYYSLGNGQVKTESKGTIYDARTKITTTSTQAVELLSVDKK